MNTIKAPRMGVISLGENPIGGNWLGEDPISLRNDVTQGVQNKRERG